MHTMFKFGDHCLAGISMMNIEPAKTYSLLVTFMLLHITIDILNYGFRIGLNIGDGEIFFKLQTGVKARS